MPTPSPRSSARRRGSTRILVVGRTPAQRLRQATTIAADLSLELYRLDLSAAVSKTIGETEKNLGRLFARAEAADAVLYFDEADALFGKRSNVKEAHDRYANIDVNGLLTRLERARGVLIVATAAKANLDSAMLRRLRFDVQVEPTPPASKVAPRSSVRAGAARRR